MAGCGSDNGVSQAEVQRQVDQARTDGAKAQHTLDVQAEKQRDLQRQLNELKKKKSDSASPPNSGGGSAGTTAPPSAPRGTSCGGGLSVGPNTTCGFAQNVRDAYESSAARGGAATVSAASATTGLIYTMSCTAGPSHVCSGGNNATVYFSE